MLSAGTVVLWGSISTHLWWRRRSGDTEAGKQCEVTLEDRALLEDSESVAEGSFTGLCHLSPGVFPHIRATAHLSAK